MPDEDELRRMLSSAKVPASIDVDAVVRRARGRRRPKQLASGAVGALAVLGFAALALPVVFPLTQPVVAPMSDLAGGVEESADAVLRVAADSLNQCGAPLAGPVEADGVGLTLEVVVPETAAAGSEVRGTVVLSNAGSETITGTTAPPTVVLARDGIVVWHSGSAGQATTTVRLDPGQRLELPITLEAVECGSEQHLRSGAALDPVVAGTYQVSAVADVATDAVDTLGQIVALVVAPPASITVE